VSRTSSICEKARSAHLLLLALVSGVGIFADLISSSTACYNYHDQYFTLRIVSLPSLPTAILLRHRLGPFPPLARSLLPPYPSTHPTHHLTPYYPSFRPRSRSLPPASRFPPQPRDRLHLRPTLLASLDPLPPPCPPRPNRRRHGAARGRRGARRDRLRWGGGRGVST
jgi:hypothetical protein